MIRAADLRHFVAAEWPGCKVQTGGLSASGDEYRVRFSCSLAKSLFYTSLSP